MTLGILISFTLLLAVIVYQAILLVKIKRESLELKIKLKSTQEYAERIAAKTLKKVNNN